MQCMFETMESKRLPTRKSLNDLFKKHASLSLPILILGHYLLRGQIGGLLLSFSAKARRSVRKDSLPFCWLIFLQFKKLWSKEVLLSLNELVSVFVPCQLREQHKL